MSIPIEARPADRRITVGATFRDKEQVRIIPGSRWKHGEWTVPLSWAALQQLRGIFGARLDVGPQLLDLSAQTWERRVNPSLQARMATDAPWIDEERLTPLQRAGSAFLVTAGQALQADPMGAGKTPMTIVALRHVPDPFPALIVCPNGVKPHWRNEFATWGTPDTKVQVIAGTAAQRRKQIDAVASGDAQVAVVNWDLMAKHSRQAGFGSLRLSDDDRAPKEFNEIPWRTVIADEAHRGKDPQAKQTRALWACGDAESVAYRYALTGTPLANSPADTWSIMRFVAPDEYPSKGKFIDRYALMTWSPLGFMDIVGLNGETRDEFYRFFDPRFIRRPKEIILPELKGKLPTMRRIVDLGAKQKKAYNSLRDDMIVGLDNGTLVVSNPLTLVGRLRQLAGATGDEVEYSVDPDTGKQRIKLTLKPPSSKVDELVAILDEMGEEEQAIVFADSRQLLEIANERLTKEGVTNVLFTGKVEDEAKEANRVAFVQGRARVILGTYGAMAEGVNLATPTPAATIKLEKSWSLIKDSQAEERGVRPGQGEPMRIIEVFAHDTVDDRVAEAIEGKESMAEEISRDEETLRKWLAK